jgi:hypothetical protein
MELRPAVYIAGFIGPGGDGVGIHVSAADLKTFHRFPFALRVDLGVPAAAPDGEIKDGSGGCRDEGGTTRLGHGITVDYKLPPLSSPMTVCQRAVRATG